MTNIRVRTFKEYGALFAFEYSNFMHSGSSELYMTSIGYARADDGEAYEILACNDRGLRMGLPKYIAIFG